MEGQPIQVQQQYLEQQLFQQLLHKEKLEKELTTVKKNIDNLQSMMAGIHMGRSGERELQAQLKREAEEARQEPLGDAVVMTPEE